MTDPEAKAREIVEAIDRASLQSGLSPSAAETFIATALREARNAALEEAARVAVQNAQNAFLSGSSEGQTVAFAIAARIRELKGD